MKRFDKSSPSHAAPDSYFTRDQSMVVYGHQGRRTVFVIPIRQTPAPPIQLRL